MPLVKRTPMAVEIDGRDFTNSVTTFSVFVMFAEAEGLWLTPRLSSTTFTRTPSHHARASAATAEGLPDATRTDYPVLHIASA
jgi:hypothetical protein